MHGKLTRNNKRRVKKGGKGNTKLNYRKNQKGEKGPRSPEITLIIYWRNGEIILISARDGGE